MVGSHSLKKKLKNNLCKIMATDYPVPRVEDLPFEVLTMIFVKLRVRDLNSVARTCKKLKEVVVNNNTLWRQKWNELFLVTHANNFSSVSSSFSLSPYNLCRVSSNWRNGFFKEEVVAESKIKYMPWLILLSDCLLHSTGSALTCYPRDRRRLPYGHKRLWQLRVPTVHRRGVRTCDISRFVIKDNVIVCANRDGCISIYDLVEDDTSMSPNNSLGPALHDHIKDCHQMGNVEISAIEYAGGGHCVISGSSADDVIKFWKEGNVDNVDTEFLNRNERDKRRGLYYCAHSIRAPMQGARCMQLNRLENRLAVGLKSNERPLLIDIEAGQVIFDPCVGYHNNTECVRDVTWLDDNLVSYVRHSGYLSIFDTRSCSLVNNTLDPLASSLYSLKHDGRHAIVTGCSAFSRCVLFDIRNTRTCVQILFTQKCSSPVYSVDFDSCVLTAAAERGVAVLNFNINTSNVRQRDYADVVQSFR